jgi:para-aminobenzoate synthetase component 1
VSLLVREIAWAEPARLFGHWAAAPHVAWLDSGTGTDPRGRYSYLAVEPFQVMAAGPGGVAIDGAPVPGDPFAVLERELARWHLPAADGPVPFRGGAVGFLGYELAGWLENLPQRHGNPGALPDMVMGFYDLVLGFDHRERRAWILCSGMPSGSPERAQARLDAVLAKLAQPPPPREASIPALRWRAEISRGTYEDRVAEVIGHIRAGDVFQANFTARHLADRPAGLDPARLYRALRAAVPAPFGAFLACGPDLALASASPERFLSLDAAGRIETRPIKGTRPRGRDAGEDARLRAQLLESEKDRAENLMIVDLMRNDIGRVAVTGSVAVEALAALESYSHVHHLVSSVTGRLRPGLGPVDLLRATFPGGSVTGAPKIRAMQIIDALEAARRGPYCGALAWIGFDGTMDSSILIRTLTITEMEMIAQAGGGIVADSDPAEEHAEMMVKLAPLLLSGDA